MLEPEKLDLTKRLQDDCVSFVSKVDEVCNLETCARTRSQASVSDDVRTL